MEHLLKLSGALGLFLIFFAQCGTVDIQKMDNIQKTIGTKMKGILIHGLSVRIN